MPPLLWWQRVRPAVALTLAGLLLLSTACGPILNYSDPAGPRYEGHYGVGDEDTELRVVTFNIKFARRIDEAIDLFRTAEPLRTADVIALQEMDQEGVERMARALSLNYVYYPAARHPAHDRNFGNAILSRWPIQDDRKIVLPRRGRFRAMQRIAVSATVVGPGGPVRVYSVHTATPGSMGRVARQRQAAAVIHDALRYPRVIVAGDFNSHALGELFEWYGFRWLTRDLGSTISVFSWDHLFVRGLEMKEGKAAGVVRDNKRASDHRPVWAVLESSDLRPPSLDASGAVRP